jgi:hypothetical protein
MAEKKKPPLHLRISRITRSAGHPEGPARGSFDLVDEEGRRVAREPHTGCDSSITRAAGRILRRAAAQRRSVELIDGSVIDPSDDTEKS